MPGYNTDVLMQVDKEGRWRGQCAEYCGIQHAHMSFFLVGESQKDFDNWMTAQAQSSVVPTNAQTMHGQQVFLVMPAFFVTPFAAPRPVRVSDLILRTSLADPPLRPACCPIRSAISAAGYLNAQALKPGCRMPPNQISGPDLQDLLAYLETLR